MLVKRLLTLMALVMLVPGCSTSPHAKKKRIPVKTLNDVLTNLSPGTLTYEFDPGEDKLIRAEKGTVIFIPAGAFQFADGSLPNGKVSIELKECFSIADMIGEDLSTLSGNQVLQTGGMIHIRASAGGKELSIRDGKAFVIGFPKNDAKDTMDLFYEIKDGNGKKTWGPDYKMYALPGEGGAASDSSAKEGDGRPIRYPVEMTEDLYDYGFSWDLTTSTLFDVTLKGRKQSILDYINDPGNIPDSVAKLFYDNGWRVQCDFNIDATGRMNNFRLKNNELTKYNKYAADVFLNFLRAAPAYDLHNYKEEVPPDWDYSLGVVGSKLINWDRFKIKFREKFADYKNKAIQKLDKEALSLYMFSATKLGWINCDKFWDTKDEKIDFYVKTANPKDAKLQIVFSDIRSIMNGTLEGDRFVFNNVPLGRKIKIVGISYLDGKPTMSSMMGTTSRNGVELTGFREFSFDDLEKELNKPD